MSYIWINPVVDSMYERTKLDKFLQGHGYQRLEVMENWGKVVKEKYEKVVGKKQLPVMDMRCPEIRKMLESMEIREKVLVPEIEPILIHCGQELGERADLLEEKKIITTPCQSLADRGNELGLENTQFIPWNRFLEGIGEWPEAIALENSPIPPGFFDELKIHTVSITGEKTIRNYLENGIEEGVQLVEMLFCENGCHNGDGIRDYKR